MIIYFYEVGKIMCWSTHISHEQWTPKSTYLSKKFSKRILWLKRNIPNENMFLGLELVAYNRFIFFFFSICPGICSFVWSSLFFSWKKQNSYLPYCHHLYLLNHMTEECTWQKCFQEQNYVLSEIFLEQKSNTFSSWWFC